LKEIPEIERLSKPAIVIAPCPHSFECPMKENGWCHFSQRVQRMPTTTGAKIGSSRNWEDEKFSYIVLWKPSGTEGDIQHVQQQTNTPENANLVESKRRRMLDRNSNKVKIEVPNAKEKAKPEKLRSRDSTWKSDRWARILSHPIKRGGHILMDMCTVEGTIKRYIIPRSDGKLRYKAARKSLWGDGFYVDKPDLSKIDK